MEALRLGAGQGKASFPEGGRGAAGSQVSPSQLVPSTVQTLLLAREGL